MLIYGCRPPKILLFLLYHIVVCFDKYSMPRRIGGGMTQPGKQSSDPEDDSYLVRGLEDLGKYSRNGKFSMKMGSGADRAGALGRNVFENKGLVKI
jgi:hypothetical protein